IAVSTLFETRTAARLAARLASAPAAGTDLVPCGELVRCDRGGPLGLSPAQQRLWFLHRLDPTSDEYQAPIALRLTGPIDPDALARAVNAVAARHEVLRTRYAAAAGVAYQIVDPPSPVPLVRR